MADMEDAELTIDGRAIDNLRVVDLKQELKKKGLSISGSKSVLVERLRAQMYLEQLQQESAGDGNANKQIVDESVASNSFIKQYLEQQQELLRQRQTEKEHEEKQEQDHCAEVSAALADQVEELHQSLSRSQSQEDAKKAEEKSAEITTEEKDEPVTSTESAVNKDLDTNSTVTAQKAEVEDKETVAEDKETVTEDKEAVAEMQVEESKVDQDTSKVDEEAVGKQTGPIADGTLQSMEGGQEASAKEELDQEKSTKKVEEKDQDIIQEKIQEKASEEVQEKNESGDAALKATAESVPECQQDEPIKSPQAAEKIDVKDDATEKEKTVPSPETEDQQTSKRELEVSQEQVPPKRPRRWSRKSEEDTVLKAESKGHRSSIRRRSGTRLSDSQEQEERDVPKEKTEEKPQPSDIEGPVPDSTVAEQQQMDVGKESEDKEEVEEQDQKKSEQKEDTEKPMEEAATSKEEEQPDAEPRDESYFTAEDTSMDQGATEPPQSAESKGKNEPDDAEEQVPMETSTPVAEVVEETKAETKKDEDIEDADAAEKLEEVGSQMEKEPSSEMEKSSLVTPAAVKTKRFNLGSSKEKDKGVSDKTSPGTAAAPISRKRRWGSNKNVTQVKKLSVNISTDILKEIMPEMKQTSIDTVVMETEEKSPSSLETSEEEDGTPREPTITRTITQTVKKAEAEAGSDEDSDQEEKKQNGQEKEEEGKVNSSNEENHDGNKSSSDSDSSDSDSDSGDDKDSNGDKGDEEKMEEDEDAVKRREMRSKEKAARHEQKAAKQKAKEERAKESLLAKRTKLREVVRTSIDEPVRSVGRPTKPSPSRRPESNIVHVMNLVRPYTLNQLKELLGRSGKVEVEDGFWIDNIKSHCYAVFSSPDEAVACREDLHGTKWPSSNPKTLRVDFATKDEMDRHTGKSIPKPEPKPEPATGDRVKRERRLSERDKDQDKEKGRDKGGHPPMREWDRDRERSLSRERRRREREKRHAEQKAAKEEVEEPPAKLLDDLFKKTKATPCIYWLPLTEEQVEVKIKEIDQREKDRVERRRKLDEEDRQREKEKAREQVRGGRRRSRSRSRSRGRRR